jgi:hypothetical protein
MAKKASPAAPRTARRFGRRPWGVWAVGLQAPNELLSQGLPWAQLSQQVPTEGECVWWVGWYIEALVR